MQRTEIALPAGVRLRPLQMHADDRGCFSEVFRASWDTGCEPVQWNVVSSEAGVMRGVHVHVRHTDYLIVVSGRSAIGLRDLRRGSPTEGLATVVEMRDDELGALTIPPGVAHGFYMRQRAMHLYSVSHYWATDDEFGCHWADPELGIPWAVEDAAVSQRDAEAPTLSGLLAEIEPFQPFARPS